MALTIYICPDCSGIIQFTHTICNVRQCKCGSVLELSDNDTILKKGNLIVQSVDGAIKVGTIGVWNNTVFTVLGRVRLSFKDGLINYWTIVFQNNELAWLSESYGLYNILRKTNEINTISSSHINILKTGGEKELLTGEAFQLKSKDVTTGLEIEGELWLPKNNGTLCILDFAAPSGKKIKVIEFLREYIISFEVNIVSFSELKLSKTNAIDLKGKSFTCQKCGKPFKIKAWPYTKSYVCTHCRSSYIIANETLKRTELKKSLEKFPDIEIGSSGVIKGISYELIGYALKQDDSSYLSQWKEYTLYNFEEGYAFLSEYNGNWIYVREKDDAPVLINHTSKSFEYDQEAFLLYNKYGYDVVDALGEFPYDIYNTSKTKVKEFISPPEMWIEEQDPNTITWFLGEYVSKEEISKQFIFPKGIPLQKGIGAINPKGYVNPAYIIRVAIIALLILTGAHISSNSGKLNKTILDTQLYFDSSNSAAFVSEKLNLEKFKSNLEFEIASPVDNSWAALSASLVDINTGTEYKLEQGVEYYHGYDGGEWREGSRDETAYMSSIPQGTYVLQLDAIRESGYNAVANISVKVSYDTPNDRNLAIIIVLVLIWPLAKYLLISYNEKRRWEDSPFSPYTYEE